MCKRGGCRVLERVTMDSLTENMTFETLEEDVEESYEDNWGKNKPEL